MQAEESEEPCHEVRPYLVVDLHEKIAVAGNADHGPLRIKPLHRYCRRHAIAHRTRGRGDVLRKTAEAKKAMKKLHELGIRIVMLTGDNEIVAKEIARELGIVEYRSSLKPEDKLNELEKLIPRGPICMIGDGINDAPALSRSDVGIAMGGGGTAVAVESADIVILNDDLSKVAEMINLGRQTQKVVKTDIIIWILSNAIGFYLVFSGIAGLAFAAFYNFATDFLPLGNSVLFFKGVKKNAK